MSYLVDEYDARLNTAPAYSEYPIQDHHALPRIGQTRCYWALLSSGLQFIYLDPVLQSHLEEQADLLVGKSLLAFVHPDEQASAKQDLGGVLESRNLSGSVTRVRFSRLSKVRRQLGYNGPQSAWPEADKVSLDKDYMAVEIVTNLAADGLVLCFIHATVDLTPNDNNENSKTPWSNWCGTPQMSADQIDLLYHRLVVCLPPPPTMSLVFQILSNQGDRSLLMSWPPDPANGPSRRDFAELVKKVRIDTVAGGNDAKTSCTRRYQALQNMPAEFGGEVESIFLPHGHIIFACHKVSPTVRSNGATSSLPMQQLEYAPQGYTHHQNASYYEQGTGAPYSLPPLNPHTQPYNNFVLQQPSTGTSSEYSSPRWAQDTASAQSNQQWANDNGPPTAAYLDTSQQPFSNRQVSPTYNYSTLSAGNSGSGETSPPTDIVPPPRRRISPSASRETGPIRTNSNRPTGIQKCSSCKATSSPEWRKGPSGKKELCNACGLRYARSRAKKEAPNQTQQRRRKEKALVAKRESMEPSPVFNPRRSYGETSFSSTGSASGSEIYPHSAQPQPRHSLENLTPSPSPPGSNMNFVHYAPGANDTRSSYSGGLNNFYSSSVPSPLSSQQVLHSHTSQQPTVPSQHPHMNNTQLPPLGQLSAYAGRLSPLIPPPSSMVPGGISGASHLHASYEREVRDTMVSQRDREAFRELPPTPLSAEPRIPPRRSILTQQ